MRTTRPVRIGAAVLAVGAAVVLASTPATAADPAQEARQALQGGKATNVILLIGDGMGDSEITAARNYQVGAAGRLAMDGFPLTGAITTYAVDKDDPSKPNYVTDSAASGTGWATGRKTYNGAISVTPDDKDHKTLLELAKASGYATGDVTTAELTDATPAVLASHVSDRGCQGPADMANCPKDDKVNGGPGSIAEQEVQHDVDVLLGGGKQRFDQQVKAGKYTGFTVAQQAQANDYQVVTDADGLAKANAKNKVLGLFSPSTMDLEWTGPLAKPYPANTTPEKCTPNAARPSSQPHLSDMTKKSLALLDRKAQANKPGRGFFLQIEGASIDKQDHASNPCGQIGETIEFDRSVGLARTYAKNHPGTLVIVTADHAHTSQIVEYPQTADHHATGAIATLETKDGAPMVMSYGTNVVGQSQDHTGTQLRIAAQGPQAAYVLGVNEQTDTFRAIRNAFRT